MALERGVLEDAARSVLAAAMTGFGMEQALDALAQAADAHGALIGRNPDKGALFCLCSGSIREAVAEYAAGRRPPDPRYARVRQSLSDGFAGDLAFFTREEIGRDAYYNEFLPRHGVGWHGSALLQGDGLNGLYVSLKRASARGPYLPDEIAALDAALPHLRAAAAFAREKNDLAAELLAGRFRARGDVVLRLAGEGRVLEADSAPPLAGFGLAIRVGRLKPADGGEAPELDAAIAGAAASPGVPRLIELASAPRRLLFAVPVSGAARDIFGGTAALAILIDRGAAAPMRPELAAALREAFRLTSGEATVVALIAAGLPLPEIAARMRVSPGTARNYLKSVFRKTDTRRQAELAALTARLDG